MTKLVNDIKHGELSLTLQVIIGCELGTVYNCRIRSASDPRGQNAKAEIHIDIL